MRTAILDTSALMSLYAAKLLEHLHLLFEKVLIPTEVQLEFFNRYPSEEDKSYRFDYLSRQFTQHSSWLRACQEYDSQLVQLYRTESGIDDGEAEVFAQHQAWEQLPLLVLDDNKARQYALRNSWSVVGCLKIIAHLDLRFGLCTYQDSVSLLSSGARRAYYHSTLIQQVWAQAQQELQAGQDIFDN